MRRKLSFAALLLAFGNSCVTGEGFACQGAESCPVGMSCVGSVCTPVEASEGGADSGTRNSVDSGMAAVCGYDVNPCPAGQICNLDGACAAPQYTEANGVVTDVVTGLKWQQSTPSDACPNDGDGVCNWADAKAYCSSLALRGTGWSLPTISQLFSLLDVGQNPALDPTAFMQPEDSIFWSSTETPGGDAWAVFTYGGGGVSDEVDPDDLGSVMCVK